jgi:hypothetical protein
MSAVTTAADLHRLAEEAKRRGIQIFIENGTEAHFATSASSPDRLWRVSGLSCSCPGFVAHGRCTHFAALLADKGWLPPLDDNDPDPVAPGASAVPAVLVEPEIAAPTPIMLLRPSSSATMEPATAVQEPPLAAPIMLTDPHDRAKEMQGVIEDAIERLAGQLEAGHSEHFREYLRFASQFWRYSVGNIMLILSQLPTATRVAGLRKWGELGYSVRKGERALWIWAPLTKLVVNEVTGEKVEDLIGFKPAPVFDQSQLDLGGKPLPEPFQALPDDCDVLYRQVRDRVVRAGISVEERRLPSGILGSSQGGLITITTGIGSRERLAILLHELGHELAHHGSVKTASTPEQRELEAESAAYVTGLVLGIENVNAIDYVLAWKGSAVELKASLATIQQLVKRMLAIVQPTERELAIAA